MSTTAIRVRDLKLTFTKESVANLEGCVRLRPTNAGKAWLKSKGLE